MGKFPGVFDLTCFHTMKNAHRTRRVPGKDKGFSGQTARARASHSIQFTGSNVVCTDYCSGGGRGGGRRNSFCFRVVRFPYAERPRPVQRRRRDVPENPTNIRRLRAGRRAFRLAFRFATERSIMTGDRGRSHSIRTPGKARKRTARRSTPPRLAGSSC